MACCYIAALCIGTLVKACQFLDSDDNIHYNEDGGSKLAQTDQIHHEKTEEPVQPSSRPSSMVLSLSGLTCAACVSTVEHALSDIPYVQHARVSLPLQQVTLMAHDGHFLDENDLIRAVESVGYGAELGPRPPKEITEMLQSRREVEGLKKSFIGVAQHAAAIQSVGYILSRIASIWPKSRLEALTLWISLALAADCQLRYVPWIHSNGWRALAHGAPNMNSLMSLSVCLGLSFSLADLFARGADASSYHSATVGITLVIIGGRCLEALSRRQSSKDLLAVYKPLMELDYARLSSSGKLVPSTYLRPGDTILVEPFSVICCDCYVVSGSSLVNQAVVTGEAIPAKRTAGDFLYGGTRNLNRSLTCVVHKTKQDSFYGQLVQNVTSIKTSKEGSFGYVDALTRYFVTVVIVLAVVVPVVEQYLLLGNNSPYAILRSYVSRCMTILVSACPCALGSAIPSAVVAATYSLRKKGVLLTGGVSTIDALARTNFIVFDKTGTLTEARLHVEKFTITERTPVDRDELWTLVCALEEHGSSGHPIGNAIFAAGVQQLGETWLRFKSAGSVQITDDFETGGLCGEVSLNGEEGEYHSIVLGTRRYLKKHEVECLPDDDGADQGAINVQVAKNGTYAGTISLVDAIRSEAVTPGRYPGTQGNGIRLWNGELRFQLTGDTERAAARVSKHLSVAILASEATPAEKLQHVNKLRSTGKVVAMIGDGLNDALGLAAADVGIRVCHEGAVPTTGAAVTIVNSSLNAVALLMRTAKFTHRQIRFNLAWVAVYNVVALSMAAGFSPYGLTLTPSHAAALMSLSSILITLQSLLLQHL